jgi:NIMA (never in mitosis gene a)-related kinase
MPIPTRANSQPQSSATTKPNSAPFPSSKPIPDYDLNDEENLPSPFLKKIERGEIIAPASTGGAQATRPPKRISNSNLLRAVAAANTVNGGKKPVVSEPPSSNQARPLLVSARKASEEARKVLLRP